eukprot:5876766-Amphidinium_carterae.1
MAAPHLLLSINRLSSQVTRWTRADDQALSQIFRCIAGSGCRDMLAVEVSRDARNHEDMHVGCYADADLSCDSTRTAKCTIGYWAEFVSNGHRFPISWCSKRQTTTSVSTAEAELVAMTSAVKESAIPAQVLLAVAFSIGMLSEALLPHEIGTAEILPIDSANRKADALTKSLIGDKFQAALDMMNIRAPNDDSTKCLPVLNGVRMQFHLQRQEVLKIRCQRKDASSFPHQVHHLPKNPLCRHCVLFKTKASPARVRKISLSEQASITEAFQ